MTERETAAHQFIAALLGTDTREEHNQQFEEKLDSWHEFWTAMAGRAGAVSDLARSKPEPDEAGAEEKAQSPEHRHAAAPEQQASKVGERSGSSAVGVLAGDSEGRGGVDRQPLSPKVASPGPSESTDLGEVVLPIPASPSFPPGLEGSDRGTSGRRVYLLIALGVIIGIVLGVGLSQSWGFLRPNPIPQVLIPPAANVGPEVAIPALGIPIQVGKAPTFVAVSPNGQHVYVADRDAQLLTVLDTAVNQVTATIPIPNGPPRFLAFAPDGRTLYVTIFNDRQTSHSLDVIDTASNTVIASIPQPGRPLHPAVTPDGTRLFVPNQDIATVSVIDTNTNKVFAEIKAVPDPTWVAISPDGRRAYITSHESNAVSVIDVATLAIRATIPVGTSPQAIAVNPWLSRAASVNYNADTVSVIDTITNQVTATIPVGHNPQNITWAPDGRFAYIVNRGSDNVSVIDARTNKVTANIPTGADPTSIAVLPNATQAYVTNLNSGTLTVLQLTG